MLEDDLRARHPVAALAFDEVADDDSERSRRRVLSAAGVRARRAGARLYEFARLRSANLEELHALNLQPADLEKRGHHPVLGPVTLSELLATWAAHDLTHLHQLSRVMAYQQREAVGPWTKFLGVLHCNGHSE